MLFDSTVRKELARGFGATLVVILTIVLTMFLIRTVGQAANGVVAPQDVVLLLGYVALGHLPTMIALSLFIAIVVSLGRMYRESEMAIWFASGIALASFVRPVMRVSWPLLLVVGALLLVVWPWGNRNSLELRERYQKRSDLSRIAPGIFQKSSNGERVFFVERETDGDADSANARNVFILTQQPRGESVTTARTGRVEFVGDDRFLVLERGQRNDAAAKSGERTLASFESYRVLFSDGAGRDDRIRPPKTQPTLALLRDPTLPNRAELTWRFGQLFGSANLLLLAVGLSATHPRRASNWNLLFALFTFVIYYNLISISQSWVATGRLSMAAALLLLHGTALALALALIWWRDHGTVLSFGRRAPRPAVA